jgi:cation diffusion facilitator CzcD-associated flavoprotein CzcO
VKPRDVDVLIVGAGISGVSAAWHLSQECPGRSYAILEGRDDLGGTWDLFRYPGVRSDSDMHTLGFSFKPWTSPKSIADGPSILAYVNETVDEFGIRPKIRFNHQVSQASWSTDDATWTLTANTPDGEQTLTSNFLFMCSGYYSYKGGHRPEFAGSDDFAGDIIHPQEWPADFDHADKRIVVIGSGATAVTLVPAMAETAEHVTMLQRSPTWMGAKPDEDAFANNLRRVLPSRIAYGITRKKNVLFQQTVYRKTRTDPEAVRERLLTAVKEELPDDYDIDTHFTPSYDPWDQRLCLVPNGDLFESIRNGSASVVTDHIERFTESGVQLKSGEHLHADAIVTATGLELVTLGDMDFVVDGETVDFADTWTYKGLGYSDIPNLISTFGYINASWTLRADLTSQYVCRLLNHMRSAGASRATPRLRPSDVTMPTLPWIKDFSSGYMQRMMPLLPKQGDRQPWTNPQNLSHDRKAIAKSPIDDGVMTFT